VSRELDRAYLKRSGRGVPPPRPEPAPFVVMGDGYTSHAFCDKCLAGRAGQPTVRVYENRGPAWDSL
jgi:hypothetical protein